MKLRRNIESNVLCLVAINGWLLAFSRRDSSVFCMLKELELTECP